jgi:hypothetical protein
LKPLSPAKPQQSTESTLTTLSLQRVAMAANRSTVPILRALHTGWIVTVPDRGSIATRGSTSSWMNSMLSCTVRRCAKYRCIR